VLVREAGSLPFLCIFPLIREISVAMSTIKEKMGGIGPSLTVNRQNSRGREREFLDVESSWL
jgi:hypothetical protein